MHDQLRPIRVMIVDDEEPARCELKYLLGSFPEIEIVGEFSGGDAVISAVSSLNPHLIFMDIEMAGLNGIQTAEKMNNNQIVPLLVFATAHEEFAIKAFELNAIDYLLKPFSASRVAKCVEKVRALLSEAVQPNASRRAGELVAAPNILKKLAIEHNGKAFVIDTKDIIAVCCREGQLSIRTLSKCYYSNMSLQEFHCRLGEQLFFRTHRGYLVNIEKIREIIPWFNGTYNLILEGLDEEVPVSRQQVPKLKKIFGL